MPERAVIHLNVVDFAVAVERVLDPRLRGRPVIVAPQGTPRAVVYDMSEEAYRCGVSKGMPLGRAMRLCRDAHLLAPHPDRYEQAMRAVYQQIRSYSPHIETGEVDGHLFVDATGTGRLFGPPRDVAWRLRRRIRNQLGLDPIWSVASNKLVAKVATRIVKPKGECQVAAGKEAFFLAPLPVRLVPGLESGDLARLQELNLHRVSQVTALSLAHLELLFGNRARFVFDTLRGIDPSPVLSADRRRSEIRTDYQFGEDTNRAPLLESALYAMVENVAHVLRRQRLGAGRLRIVLDYSDGRRTSRHVRLRPLSADDRILFDALRPVFRSAASRRVRIRHLGLICDRLDRFSAQRKLFAADRRETESRSRLTAAVDEVRRRFGPDVVRMGRALAATSGPAGSRTFKSAF